MTLADLRYKEVINVSSGQKIGYICDCEIEVEQGKILSLIVPGKYKLFGLLGREDDYVIPWEKINIIGDDLILVDYELQRQVRRKKSRKKLL